jgi:hypothetical protein
MQGDATANIEKMRKFQEQEDAFLDEFEKDSKNTKISSGGDGGSEEEDGSSSGDSSDGSGEEELVDIDFPRDDPQELYQYFHREWVNLSNQEDGQKRKFALIKLYEVFVLAKVKAKDNVYQELLPMI